MRGHVSIGRVLHGGRWSEPPTAAPERALVDRDIARLARLDRELQRARARYERAIAALDAYSAELETHPPADEIVEQAMRAARAEDEARDHRVPLGSVTFEDLRALGLSVNQARRILRLRNDGVILLASDLELVNGLPRAEVARLSAFVRD